LSKGVDMGQVTGTGAWELPMPTVVLVDRDRTVRFADVSPDWLVRTEAETILASVRKLVGVAA
jgi:peroxiredoxin